MKNKCIIIGMPGLGEELSRAFALSTIKQPIIHFDNNQEKEMRLLGLDEITIKAVLNHGLSDEAFRSLINICDFNKSIKSAISSFNELAETLKSEKVNLSFEKEPSKYINKPRYNFKRR